MRRIDAGNALTKRQGLRLESLESRQLLAGDLRIVEFDYHPHAAMTQFGEHDKEPEDFEFIEVMNVGDSLLNLNGYEISDGVKFRFGQQFLAAGSRLVVTKDIEDFRSRYGTEVDIAFGSDGEGGKAGEYKGSLKDSGELLVLRGPDGRIVQEFEYFDRGEWPVLADGQGSSLEVIDVYGDYDDPKNWLPSAEYGGSPGMAGEGFIRDVVINELLTHTDLPQIDTIELFNRNDESIDMTGWYLTDSVDDIFRYRLSGRLANISGHDYQVFDEIELGFSFRGQEADNAFLIEADESGRPVRFVDAVSFAATQNGISLGRWDNGEGQLFPMDDLTFEDDNSGPLIGDIVISEVHYHPADPPPGSPLRTDDLEFVELHNRTGTPLDIGQWRLREAVDLTIPDGVVIGAGETLVAVGFDPDSQAAKEQAFRDYYGLTAAITLIGPYSDQEDPNSDQLDDQGERLIWERPEDYLQLGLGYVLVDRVTYSDSGDWPEEADGQGESLVRVDLGEYGDAAENWVASKPTPGTTGIEGDFNGDGVVDAIDLDTLCAVISLGSDNPLFDMNGDSNVDTDDLSYIVNDILGTTLGDANLDGRFDSGDLVQVFIRGEYQDGVSRNSSWESGDWNCDTEFDSSDLVAAFAEGGYVSGASAAEPARSSLPRVARRHAWR